MLEKNLVGVERGRRRSSVHWSSPSENRSNDEHWELSWSWTGRAIIKCSLEQSKWKQKKWWTLSVGKELVWVERGRRRSSVHWSSPSEQFGNTRNKPSDLGISHDCVKCTRHFFQRSTWTVIFIVTSSVFTWTAPVKISTPTKFLSSAQLSSLHLRFSLGLLQWILDHRLFPTT